MRAVEITQPGGPEVLKPADRPKPSPKPGEILIKVAAAGVNRPDVLQRMGMYPVPPGASDLPGLEIAGEVVDTGEKVCALVAGGGYAEYCVAPQAQVLPVPKGLTMIQAASLPETFFTVWSNVYDRARLAPGESFLVQGGSSGIGVTAIQMAAATGNRVFATAGSDDKVAACMRLGATEAFNYKTQDFEKELLRATGGKGVNVILDMVGGDYVPRNLRSLASDGRLSQIAFLKSSTVELDMRLIMMKRLTVTGSTLRASPSSRKVALARALREKVWPLFAQGKVKVVIAEEFPLADAAKAHALMESGALIGKIALKTSSGNAPA